jgi:fucose 4-O-acetylase-like acetyltransferase
MVASEIEQNVVKGNRIYFLDNLRTFMIFLVVLIHAGGVYESSGGWALFWIVDDPSTNHLSDILLLIIDIFVMPTIFFISGFMAPMSLKNKNGLEFLKSKTKRLMVPWVIAALTLIPLYKFIFLYSRNIPQERWMTYFHWSSGNLTSQNWLWFLPVLFLFNLLYMLFSKVKIRILNISLKAAVLCTFIAGFAYSVSMDILGLQGWTKTPLIDFQNERLFVYFMIFLLGSLFFRQNILATKPKSKKLYIAAIITAWMPITLYRFFYIKSIAITGNYVFSEVGDTVLLWLSFHLSLLCLLYLSVETFWRYFDRSGRIWEQLNKNSYFVYITHVVLIGAIALPLLNSTIHSTLKYLFVTVSAYAACNMIVCFYRKVINSNILIKRMGTKTMKTLTTTILIVTLLVVVGCRKKENQDAEIRPPHVSIQIAALQGNVDAINQHINAGSDLDVKDEYGSTPLIIATTFGKTEVALALVEAGADMEITNHEGSTALLIAAFLCRTEIVEALLDNGADKNALNNAGRTALETVAGPFDNVKVIYDHIGKGLKPLGLRLDYDRIKRTRPKIAEMLR